MRLSEKGFVHLNEWMVHKLPIDAFEFKSEDFTNCVVLTIKEAKLILEALLRLPVEGNKLILKKTLIPLKERIERAEKE